MKTLKYLFTAIVFIPLMALSQKIITKDFKSGELAEVRQIRIYLPPSYEKDKERLFPLTVVLDGDFLFDAYVGNASLFATMDKAPEQIVVGIFEGDKRNIDFAYDKITSLPNEFSNYFYRFVRGELLQFIQQNYRISPFRTIVGYGLSANFVNYFAIENVPAFDAYVSIDPAFALDMPGLIANKFEEIRDKIVYYYLNTGTFQPEEEQLLVKKTFKTIQLMNNEFVRLKYDYFDTSATPSVSYAMASALAHIFDIYSAISEEEFKHNVAHLSPPDAIAYLENKYVEIEYLFGTHMKIREKDIFAIEPIVIDQEDGLYLEEFGNMILKLYPESPIGDYYLGLFYEKGQKYKQALKHYKIGYAKMDSNSADAEGYYQNIERILEIQRREEEAKEAEKQARLAEKEAEKEARKAEKEALKAEKEAEKAEREKQKALYKEKKEKEKEERKKNKEKGEDDDNDGRRSRRSPRHRRHRG